MPRRIALTAALCLLALLLTILLSRGTAGGDEEQPSAFAMLWWKGGWSVIANKLPLDYIAHRFFWALEKTAWNGFIILFPGVSSHEILHYAVLVMDGVLFMLAALLIAIWHLHRRGYSWAIACLSAASLLISSSAISFFGGGILECQMFFYVVVIVVAIDAPRHMTRPKLATLLISSAFLIFSRIYASIFLLPLSLLFGRRTRPLYAVWVVGMTGLWWLLQQAVAGSAPGGMVAYYTQNYTDKGDMSLLAIPFRLGEMLFSPGYGLVWCFPFLFLAVIAAWHDRFTFLVKLAGVLLLAGLLCTFDFWPGWGASAGQRYLVPFLLIFLPEVAFGFRFILNCWRWAGILVPLLTLLFLPSIEYRNTLLYNWTDKTHFGFLGWGYGDPLLHPGIFAWRVIAAKERGAVDFQPSADIPLVVHTNAIVPMTGVSRLIYALEQPEIASDPRSHGINTWLARLGLDKLPLWIAVRGVMIAALFVWLFGAAALAATAPRRLSHGEKSI